MRTKRIQDLKEFVYGDLKTAKSMRCSCKSCAGPCKACRVYGRRSEK